jgi:hypothetical protein
MAMTSWRSFDRGSTIGKEGSEGGLIILDEEHPEGARITLEQSTRIAPFAITCGIYGWFFHTCYFGDENQAKTAFGAMKDALSDILDGMIASSDPTSAEKARHDTLSAIEDFISRFPT